MYRSVVVATVPSIPGAITVRCASLFGVATSAPIRAAVGTSTPTIGTIVWIAIDSSDDQKYVWLPLVGNVAGSGGGGSGAKGDKGDQGIQGIQGVAGTNGTNGTNGSNGAAGSTGAAGTNGATWRDGTGAPSNGLGANGDYYLDDATGNVYLRTSGTYSIAANIKGATGSTGAAGTNGTNGSAGAAGANGSVWRDGTGVPSNGLGANGDYYLNDANGDVYLRASGTYSIIANIKGATGSTGTAGTNGTNGTNGPNSVSATTTTTLTGILTGNGSNVGVASVVPVANGGVPQGAFTTWTPTVKQGVSTNIAKTVNYAAYVQIGKLVIGACRVTLSGAGTAGSDLNITVPVPEAFAVNVQVGSGFLSNGGVNYKMVARVTGGSGVFAFLRTDDSSTSTAIGTSPSVAAASGNIITFQFFYEAA